MPVNRGQVRTEDAHYGDVVFNADGYLQSQSNLVESTIEYYGSFGAGSLGGDEMSYGTLVSKRISTKGIVVCSNNAQNIEPADHILVYGVLVKPESKSNNRRGAIGNAAPGFVNGSKKFPYIGDLAEVVTYGYAWMRADAIVPLGNAVVRVSNSTTGANSNSVSGCLTLSSNTNALSVPSIQVIRANRKITDAVLVFVNTPISTNLA